MRREKLEYLVTTIKIEGKRRRAKQREMTEFGWTNKAGSTESDEG